MPKLRDITGQRFGKLVAREIAARGKQVKWLCVCDCGARKVVPSADLVKQNVKSCGCWQFAGHRKTHGRSRTAEYDIWTSMKARCSRPTDKRYSAYGGRGIRVCEEWKDFAAFYLDMGPRPSPAYSIERRDVNGHYERSNCYWRLSVEQARNKTNNLMLEHGGRRMCAAEWAREAGITTQHFVGRLKSGWSLADAIALPKGTKNPRLP